MRMLRDPIPQLAGKAEPPEVFLPINVERAWNERKVAGARVLVIDDDADAREMIRAFLGLAGMEVRIAAGVRDAMAAVEGFRPDVVVCDLLMPEEDGYSFLRRLRAKHDMAALPVIALTASTAANEGEHTRRAGFVRLLLKPADPHALLGLIASLLRR